MNAVIRCPACGIEIGTQAAAGNARYCFRCAAPLCSEYPAQPAHPVQLVADEPAATGVDTAACWLSALIVGVTIGVGVALYLTGGQADERLGYGAGAGVLFAVVAGRRIAGFRTIPGGIAFGAFLPFALCVLNAIRHGRLGDMGRDMQDGKFFLVLGIMFAVGGTVGGLLVAVRKLIARALAGRPAEEPAVNTSAKALKA